jgi:ornithine cyclodeaminase
LFVEEMAGKGPIPSELTIVDSPAKAVKNADVICTATTATTPVFSAEDLQPGTHINAVGAFTPEMQEIGSDSVLKARVFVDSREAALDEAGDLIIPLKRGVIAEDHILGELGEIVLGRLAGRTDESQITLFKSVGVAVQDAIAAARALNGAQDQNLGTRIEF